MAKKALLVGINDYALSGPSSIDLNGCVNDVKDVANTLFAQVPQLETSSEELLDKPFK